MLFRSLTSFLGIKAIKEATEEELGKVIGKAKAKIVFDYFKNIDENLIDENTDSNEETDEAEEFFEELNTDEE